MSDEARRGSDVPAERDDDRSSAVPEGFVRLGTRAPIWDRFFQVAPLVVVGTREPDGSFDLAPKHMVTALGWENHFAFVCTPAHGTYVNALREGAFTVSYPRPSQVLSASLAAAPRCEGDTKPALTMLDTVPATTLDGVLLRDAYLHFECRTARIVDDFGPNSLVTGRIVEARVAADSVREADRDDREILLNAPLLAYIAPGRYAEISETFAFPFHAGYTR
jgi:flavin reductase (DIM6/NTAB) family NADH-FMN oxidoreductase RutF